MTVELPQPLCQGEELSRRIVLYSVHMQPYRRALWEEDLGCFSRYFASATQAATRVVIGADWNSWPSNDLDNTGGYPPSPAWSKMKLTLDELDLVDAYRIMRPLGKEYTRVVEVDGEEIINGRRINSIWVPREAASGLTEHRIVQSDKSDHCLFLITFGHDLPALDEDCWPDAAPWMLEVGTESSSPFKEAILHCCSTGLISPVPDLSQWAIIKEELRSVLTMRAMSWRQIKATSRSRLRRSCLRWSRRLVNGSRRGASSCASSLTPWPSACRFGR
ncbi:hypothetical protein BDZ90DRAFT_88079 [Jaminaea rosea]|uniref:Endonuclease/exonuclease/phosphatase domain-containing protein n=1 Tax=Jaminaea rosea TaxID=1569628 RepID=A0A316UHS0_9BASI|nr:hypothetical protein BDZ90DRAFT_88079 [Jaminaea rosea]PWN24887.1 hypothetical protein BDZ90DRAFT_88079 [Jaminaea rosea]